MQRRQETPRKCRARTQTARPCPRRRMRQRGTGRCTRRCLGRPAPRRTCPAGTPPWQTTWMRVGSRSLGRRHRHIQHAQRPGRHCSAPPGTPRLSRWTTPTRSSTPARRARCRRITTTTAPRHSVPPGTARAPRTLQHRTRPRGTLQPSRCRNLARRSSSLHTAPCTRSSPRHRCCTRRLDTGERSASQTPAGTSTQTHTRQRTTSSNSSLCHHRTVRRRTVSPMHSTSGPGTSSPAPNRRREAHSHQRTRIRRHTRYRPLRATPQHRNSHASTCTVPRTPLCRKAVTSRSCPLGTARRPQQRTRRHKRNPARSKPRACCHHPYNTTPRNTQHNSKRRWLTGSMTPANMHITPRTWTTCMHFLPPRTRQRHRWQPSRCRTLRGTSILQSHTGPRT